jgi:hypothetical protein
VASLLLAGCGIPVPKTEHLGSTGLVFAERPLGTRHGLEVQWDVAIRNVDNTTSAAAQLHTQVKSSRTSVTTTGDQAVDPIAPHAAIHFTVKAPFGGSGDYAGMAEIVVGQTVLARVLLYYEECQVPC